MPVRPVPEDRRALRGHGRNPGRSLRALRQRSPDRTREDEPRQAGGNLRLRRIHRTPAEGASPGGIRHRGRPHALGVLPRSRHRRPILRIQSPIPGLSDGMGGAHEACRRLRLLRPFLRLHSLADRAFDPPRHSSLQETRNRAIHERDPAELGQPGNQLLRRGEAGRGPFPRCGRAPRRLLLPVLWPGRRSHAPILRPLGGGHAEHRGGRRSRLCLAVDVHSRPGRRGGRHPP